MVRNDSSYLAKVVSMIGNDEGNIGEICGILRSGVVVITLRPSQMDE